jgi:DNA-binding transcriptional ArsR family regulator
MARKTKLKKMGKRTTIDESKLKRFMDPRLVFALSHAVRAHVLVVLNEEVSSPSAVGREIGVSAAYINYHFEELEREGLIELVRVEPRRGAREHFYRARKTLVFDDRAWDSLPETFKSGITGGTLRIIYDEVAEALEAGTFTARNEMHLSMVSMPLDAKGFGDVGALLGETLEQVRGIKAESAERLAASGEETIPTTVALIGFETATGPSPSEEGPAARDQP